MDKTLGVAALSLGLAIVLSYLALDLPRVSFSVGDVEQCGASSCSTNSP